MSISRRRCLQWLPALSLLPAGAQAVAGAQRGLPALPLRQRQLANGLRVVDVADSRSASVAVQVWYFVGARDDPPGRAGFAHLFEHLMFKRTRHMPAEMFDRLTEDVGGGNNAFTAEDVTAYQSVVPANHLERLLWAEAERMAHLDVDPASFESERKVVAEEFRETVLAAPYGRLFNALSEHGFTGTTYRRPVIGSIEQLNAATLDDVRRFHATFYRPDNAVLLVSGGFDAAQLDAWVERYFAPLPRPATPLPRVPVDEPRRRHAQRVSLHGPNVPLPALALVWQGPSAASADAGALRVAAALLAGGESARLPRALVYREQVAQAVGFSADLHAGAGLLVAYAIGSAATGSPLPLETALMRQIERLAHGPIAAPEIDKVRTRLLTDALLERERPEGRAEALGWALVWHGDARQADRELAALQAVTGADVQRVLKQHVLAAKRVTLSYTRKAARAGDAAT